VHFRKWKVNENYISGALLNGGGGGIIIIIIIIIIWVLNPLAPELF
jgi:hypothetical protein